MFGKFGFIIIFFKLFFILLDYMMFYKQEVKYVGSDVIKELK